MHFRPGPRADGLLGKLFDGKRPGGPLFQLHVIIVILGRQKVAGNALMRGYRHGRAVDDGAILAEVLGEFGGGYLKHSRIIYTEYP